MKNFRGSVKKFILDDKIYYLFAFISNEGLTLRRFHFKKPKLDFGPREKKSFSKEGSYGGAVSCFVTEESKYTLCAYSATIGYQGNNYFVQLALDTDLKEKNSIIYNEYQISPDENSFIKAILLKEDIGVFSYYAYVLNFYLYPALLFKRYNINDNKFEDYFSSIPYVELHKYTTLYSIDWNNWNGDWGNNTFFNTYCLKNDLIKISENKLCFTTTSSKNETLYVALINIVEMENVVIRYYSINIFKLYNYKILLDMRAHLFNNFVALAFSYCNQSNCYTDTIGDHYSAFLLFSYPNRTDPIYYINENLFKNNDIKINNITLFLKQEAKIENNILGYVYNGFNIKENNCDRLNLLSLQTNQNLEMNERIEEENILLQFK